MKIKKAIKHVISIQPTSNSAYIVRVGCALLAYQDPKELARDLLDYLQDPEKHEKEYNELMGPTEETGNGSSLARPQQGVSRGCD